MNIGTNKPSGTVYVPHHSGQFDIQDAARFGRIQVIFRREMFPDNVDDQMPGAIRRAKETLAEFNVETDYLALVGSPVYMALCSFILGSQFECVRLLRYDRQGMAYYPIEIDVPDDEEAAAVA